MESDEPSFILDPIRERWREAAPEDAPAIAAEIAAWQNGLWHFAKVGHIGKRDGPASWQIPVSPVMASHSIQLGLPESTKDVKLYLAAGNVGGGGIEEGVIWKDAQLVRPDKPPIPLNRLGGLNEDVVTLQNREIELTEAYLESYANGVAPDGLDQASQTWRAPPTEFHRTSANTCD